MKNKISRILYAVSLATGLIMSARAVQKKRKSRHTNAPAPSHVAMNNFLATSSFPPTPTADEYETYVTKAIALSKSLANADANIRELGLFTKLTSGIQSHFATASDSISAFTVLIGAMRDLSSLTSPHGVDLEETLKQLHLSTQMLAMHRSVQENLARYEEIKSSLPDASNHHFESYDIKNINFAFADIEVELPDGVFIPLVGYDPITFAAVIVLDIFLVWQNEAEENKIKEQARRLQAEQVKTPEYRAFALQTFETLSADFQTVFSIYEPLMVAYKTWWASIPADDLQKRHHNIEGLLAQYTQEAISGMDQRARAAVQAKLKAVDDVDEILKMNIAANLRIRHNLNLLPTVSESERDGVVEQLLADVALSDVMELRSTQRLVPIILDRIGNSAPALTALQQHAVEMVIGHSSHFFDAHVLSAGTLALAESQSPSLGTCVYGGGYAFGSLCNDLSRNGPTTATGTFGTFTNPTGGFTQFDRRPLVNSYDLGGGSDLTFTPGETNPWGFLRNLIASAFDVPGASNFAYQRASQAERTLERHNQALEKRRDQLTQIYRDFNDSRENYLNDTVRPSIESTLQRLPMLQQERDNKLVPMLTTGSGLPAPGTVVLPDLPNSEIASPALQNRIAEIDALEGRVPEVWQRLEPLWITQQLRLTELNSPDRRSLQEQYDKYFDAQGILRSGFAPAAMQPVMDSISSSLRTSSNSVTGRQIRQELNRGIMASGLSTEDQQQTAIGATSLLLAADAAYADGKEETGTFLFKNGAEAVDFMLGFIPIVSSVNDATQILYGLASGHDYTGRPMEASDYAWRSVSLVLGLLPVGSTVVRIAGKRVDSAFEAGAKLIRKFNLGAKFQTATELGRAHVKDFVHAIGEMFPWQVIGSSDPEVLAGKITEIVLRQEQILELEQLGQPQRWMVDQLWLKMREAGSAVEEGSLIKFNSTSFANNIMPSDNLFARVMSNEYLEALLNSTGKLANGEEAFITAAEDLIGLTRSEEIAQRLSLFSDIEGTILKDLGDSSIVHFRFVDQPVLAFPVDFLANPPRIYGWIFTGSTQGGAREWIIDSQAAINGLIEIVGTPIKILP